MQETGEIHEFEAFVWFNAFSGDIVTRMCRGLVEGRYARVVGLAGNWSTNDFFGATRTYSHLRKGRQARLPFPLCLVM